MNTNLSINLWVLESVKNTFFNHYLRIMILNMNCTYFDCMLSVKQYNEQYNAKLLKFIR